MQVQNRNRFTDIENKLVVTKGEDQGKTKLGVLEQQIPTTTKKIEKQCAFTVWYRKLCPISFNNL